MRTFTFETRQTFQRSPSTLFPFFAEVGNLERITPPWLRFEIRSPRAITMAQGAIIDYRLRWRFLPIGWRTEITTWQPPHRFVDEQIKGPYRLWRHEHVFAEGDGSTTMTDRVDYAVPGGLLAQRLFVGRDVDRIFAYRRRVLAQLFGTIELSEASVRPAV